MPKPPPNEVVDENSPDSDPKKSDSRGNNVQAPGESGNDSEKMVDLETRAGVVRVTRSSLKQLHNAMKQMNNDTLEQRAIEQINRPDLA